MTIKEIQTAIHRRCAELKYSCKTAASYAHWSREFGEFCFGADRSLSTPQKASRFLTSIAPNCAPATQSQALNALAFLFRHILQIEMGELEQFALAKRPGRLPTWLSRQEAQRLIAELSGDAALLAKLCYGSGLRIGEAVALRIQQLDFDNGMVIVRGGKGNKDRTTCLPRSIAFELRQRIERGRVLFERDRARKEPGVCLPPDVQRKYPRFGEKWEWFWVFPGAKPSRDPETGIVRRHHALENTLQRAIYRATAKIRLGKRCTAHTLRHSFATHMLMDNLCDIYTLSELMGHALIETTSIYLHCLPKAGSRTKSPLDLGETVPFQDCQTAGQPAFFANSNR